MKQFAVRIAGACAVIIAVLWAIKTYCIPLLYQPDVYRFDDAVIQRLENDIQADYAWQGFLEIFPGSALPFTLPTYFPRGISQPLFLVERGIETGSPYSLSLWLFARVRADKNNLSFTKCLLRVDYMHDRQIIGSYTLSGDDTYRLLAIDHRDKLIPAIMETVFPQ